MQALAEIPMQIMLFFWLFRNCIFAIYVVTALPHPTAKRAKEKINLQALAEIPTLALL